jgi:hypothetical protein
MVVFDLVQPDFEHVREVFPWVLMCATASCSDRNPNQDGFEHLVPERCPHSLANAGKP